MGKTKKARHKKKTPEAQIKKESKLIWIPRFFSAVLVTMLFLFVGEIFSERFQWSHLFLSLMPGSAYLLITHIAWKNSRMGGIIFIVSSIGLILVDMIQSRNSIAAYILALATFLLGWLFLVLRKK